MTTEENRRHLGQIALSALDMPRKAIAADAVKVMGVRWLIIGGDEYRRNEFECDPVLNLTVAVPRTEWDIGSKTFIEEEHNTEIELRVSGRMFELNHERDNRFGFTGLFDYFVPGSGLSIVVPCVGFYDVPGRCGELTVFRY